MATLVLKMLGAVLMFESYHSDGKVRFDSSLKLVKPLGDEKRAPLNPGIWEVVRDKLAAEGLVLKPWKPMKNTDGQFVHAWAQDDGTFHHYYKVVENKKWGVPLP